jgi:hypothetical protein
MIVNNIIIPKKNIRTYFLMKNAFYKMLFITIHNKQCKIDEDIEYENECYYSSKFNYLI